MFSADPLRHVRWCRHSFCSGSRQSAVCQPVNAILECISADLVWHSGWSFPSQSPASCLPAGQWNHFNFIPAKFSAVTIQQIGNHQLASWWVASLWFRPSWCQPSLCPANQQSAVGPSRRIRSLDQLSCAAVASAVARSRGWASPWACGPSHGCRPEWGNFSSIFKL